MGMYIRIKGVDEMRAKLIKIAQKFPERTAAAIYREAQIEMTEAKRRTPVDVSPNAPHPGQLRASGQVSEPVRNGKNISVTLSFGGGAIDYAVYVHEIVENYHPIGQAKYLESTLNESRPYMAGRLARRILFSSGI